MVKSNEQFDCGENLSVTSPKDSFESFLLSYKNFLKFDLLMDRVASVSIC